MEKKRETNYFHKMLEALGFKVVKEERTGFSSVYTFNCGCVRTYSVNPLSFKDSERIYPCKQHKKLSEG